MHYDSKFKSIYLYQDMDLNINTEFHRSLRSIIRWYSVSIIWYSPILANKNVAKVMQYLMQLTNCIPVVEACLKQGHYILSLNLKASHLFWRQAASDFYMQELVSKMKMTKNHWVRGWRRTASSFGAGCRPTYIPTYYWWCRLYIGWALDGWDQRFQ